ncbi:superfamily II DNA/RNA helicase [Sedimentibacter acidaminivorans]|uniref:Superfamily II DNA/RNA helicase n=1 Tax=Sedimentibacter acidaminivorans TaxID=913099 RepID=A0ABS4GAC8_9FIRM|nr:DEAD/DEAH box helicase [Sedimentibacter acidaminivorans]MBP1924640.1 superfamily II DNA/RNA helicase [Sedimentibacter acidaminivorans]
MNFKNLGIDEDIINVLKNNGITSPTIVQEKCFGIINEGSDLITKAQTGTGKTLAFLLPIFENISPTSKDIQALILTPTRELAIQITDEAMKLKKAKDLNILSAYGGKDISAQIRKLKGNIHIIIATPGRLLDHLSRKTVDLNKLKILVIDEADQMLLMGFKKEVENIISHTPKARQTLCFSATIDSQVKKLAYKYMNDPINISIQNDNVTLDNIVQQVVETTDRNKQDALFNVIDEDRPFMAIIFCRTKIRVDKLEESMHSKGYNCKKLHSDILQSKREKVMKSFRSGDIQYLIATDVASRGLDISGVDHIYNYDMPENAESYIHRIGRTGRAGENGYTCLFTAKKDMEILSEIESHIGFKIERRNINI